MASPSDPTPPLAAGRTDPVPPPTPSPAVVLFDVNETLSDMAPLARRFEDVGASPSLAATWFASLLRDGFALTAAGASAPFAVVGAEVLRTLLPADQVNRSLDEAVEHVMAGFSALPVHPDVPEGLRALAATGRRLVTLSNGSASVAEGLLARAGLTSYLERLLSVEDAGAWKPAAAAYAYAVRTVRRGGEGDDARRRASLGRRRRRPGRAAHRVGEPQRHQLPRPLPPPGPGGRSHSSTWRSGSRPRPRLRPRLPGDAGQRRSAASGRQAGRGQRPRSVAHPGRSRSG